MELYRTSTVMNKVNISLVKGWAGIENQLVWSLHRVWVSHWLFRLMKCAELIALLSHKTGMFLRKLMFVFYNWESQKLEVLFTRAWCLYWLSAGKRDDKEKMFADKHLEPVCTGISQIFSRKIQLQGAIAFSSFFRYHNHHNTYFLTVWLPLLLIKNMLFCKSL